MAMILNRTAGMLSCPCNGVVHNFVPGIATRVSNEDLKVLSKNRSFAMWMDDEKLVSGSQARKEDKSDEIKYKGKGKDDGKGDEEKDKE